MGKFWKIDFKSIWIPYWGILKFEINMFWVWCKLTLISSWFGGFTRRQFLERLISNRFVLIIYTGASFEKLISNWLAFCILGHKFQKESKKRKECCLLNWFRSNTGEKFFFFKKKEIYFESTCMLCSTSAF